MIESQSWMIFSFRSLLVTLAYFFIMFFIHPDLTRTLLGHLRQTLSSLGCIAVAIKWKFLGLIETHSVCTKARKLDICTLYSIRRWYDTIKFFFWKSIANRGKNALSSGGEDRRYNDNKFMIFNIDSFYYWVSHQKPYIQVDSRWVEGTLNEWNQIFSIAAFKMQ